LGVAAGVRAVGVVVVKELVEVASERGELGHEGAGEVGAPTFLEDGELHALDAAVACGAAGLDAPLVGPGGFDDLMEVGGDELRAVIRR
jgi:hypothetical protein